MKSRTAAFLTAILICVFCAFPVLAKGRDFSFEIPDEMTAGYTDSNLEKVAEAMKIKPEELKKQCENENVLFLAVNSDNTVQARLSRYKTELSERLGDMSGMTEGEIRELLGENGESGYKNTVIGELLFLSVTDELSDSGGKYRSTQYITVNNGFIYHLSLYASENADTYSAEKMINSFKIEKKTVYSVKQKIIISSAITVFAVLIGFMIYGIIKDIRNKEE